MQLDIELLRPLHVNVSFPDDFEPLNYLFLPCIIVVLLALLCANYLGSLAFLFYQPESLDKLVLRSVAYRGM